MDPEQAAAQSFRSRFGVEPDTIVRAPGRVNLVGDHTDYNNGFVLPMAIDRTTVIASRSRSDRAVTVVSDGFGEAAFDLSQLESGSGRSGETRWSSYLEGVAWAMGAERLRGWEGVITSTIPLGASLSSSAALEIATALTFSVHAGLPWDAVEGAVLCQRAENEWVGMQSGIMDQLIVAIGETDHAMLIDCRDLSTDRCPLPEGTTVVVLDTSTRRQLTASAYNQRRVESAAAAEAFRVTSLRDLDLSDLSASGLLIDPLLMQRARHVVTENARTLAAAEAMTTGDAARLGALMDDSHESLRDDYQVSSPALNAMVTAARAAPGCLGARMTGGGFAGCAVALVEEAALRAFERAVAASYAAATGLSSTVYDCSAAAGASVVQRP